MNKEIHRIIKDSNRALISVIIPVFNCEYYLRSSIESVRSQTYTQLQIILVDDGSKDNSGSICDIFSKKDNRILSLHKTNGGVSTARNMGMKYATGEYIMFLDADDQLHPYAIERMYTSLIQSNRQIAFCSILKTSNPKDIIGFKHRKPDNNDYYLSAQKAQELIIYKKPFAGSCCAKLFSRALIEDLKFRDISMCEDQVFVFEALSKLAGDIVITGKKPLYCYIQRERSAMHTLLPAHLSDAIQSGVFIIEIAKNQGKPVQKSARCYAVNAAFFAILNTKNTKEYDDIRLRSLRIIKDNRIEVLRSRNIPIKTKAACILSFFSMNACKKVYSIIKK